MSDEEGKYFLSSSMEKGWSKTKKDGSPPKVHKFTIYQAR